MNRGESPHCGKCTAMPSIWLKDHVARSDEKKAPWLVNRSLIVHGEILGRRIRVLTHVRTVHRTRERSRPRRTSTGQKWLSDWRGNRRRVGGLKASGRLKAKPVTSTLRTIDIDRGVTAYSIRSSTLVVLEGRRWRRKDRVRTLTVILGPRVRYPLAEGLWFAIALL